MTWYQWLEEVPDLRLVHTERFSGLLYMASGGFNYPNMLPPVAHRMLLPIESLFARLLHYSPPLASPALCSRRHSW